MGRKKQEKSASRSIYFPEGDKEVMLAVANLAEARKWTWNQAAIEVMRHGLAAERKAHREAAQRV